MEAILEGMVDVAALKKFLVLGLNATMLVGSTMFKVPQVVKIAKAWSVVGLSELFVINELLGTWSYSLYCICQGHRFMSWGENVVISSQNLVILMLFWYLKPELPRAPRIVGFSIFVVASVLALLWGLPALLLRALGWAPIVVNNCAKIPQVWMNFSRKSTGAMSVVPCFLGMAGTAVRTFTSFMQTRDDVLSILNPAVASIFWGTLFFQFCFYYSNTQALDKKQE